MTNKNQSNSRSLSLLTLTLMILLAVIAVILVYLLSRPVPQDNGSIPSTLEARMTYEVLGEFPHDPEVFTEGLIYLDGVLYESYGLYGSSGLRMVDLETGEVLRQVDLPIEYFGEGLTDWAEALVQLTWQEGRGFVYARDDFSLLQEFQYETEGWGLTHDGEHLIMSDGTDTLYFLDPGTFAVVSTVDVRDERAPITMINELEYIHGEIYANIWLTDNIVRIDPETGAVTGWIDLSGLLPEEERTPSTNVLNGIAYDAEDNRLFVTGKLWPKLYEIRLVPIDAGN